MSLLIDDQKFINLKYHYLEIPGKYVPRFKFIQNKEEYEKNKDDPNLKELNTGWKALTWADHNKIYAECFKYGGTEEGLNINNLDFIKFRDMKLKACLKQWDLKDPTTGQSLPVTPMAIDKLHPDVANELLNGFERVTEITEEQGKN